MGVVPANIDLDRRGTEMSQMGLFLSDGHLQSVRRDKMPMSRMKANRPRFGICVISATRRTNHCRYAALHRPACRDWPSLPSDSRKPHFRVFCRLLPSLPIQFPRSSKKKSRRTQSQTSAARRRCQERWSSFIGGNGTGRRKRARDGILSEIYATPVFQNFESWRLQPGLGCRLSAQGESIL